MGYIMNNLLPESIVFFPKTIVNIRIEYFL